MQVRQSVWWPRVTSQVQQFVENCQECAKEARPRKEPLLPTSLLEYLWQVVATDLFELKGEHYLLLVARLFLSLPRIVQAGVNHFQHDYHLVEINVCPTWDTRSSAKQQRTTVCLRGICRLHESIWVPAPYKFSKISTKQQAGGVHGTDHKRDAQACQRSTPLIQNYTNVLVWLEPI